MKNGNGNRPKEVLCVEDDEDTCGLISFLLKKHRISSADTTEKALKMAKKDAFDLIIVDYHLPDGNGADLCKAIRKFNTTTAILFVTGSKAIGPHEIAACGAQGVVYKAEADFTDKLARVAADLLSQTGPTTFEPGKASATGSK